MDCFVNGFRHVNLFASSDGKSFLYQNQIAAVGATIAHFSTRKEPALITMPTGTGKTAVMILLSYVLKARKVLVITPSQLVREQIAASFENPQLLIQGKVLNGGKKVLPKVFELTKIIEDEAKWSTLISNYDVIVGIPNTINQVVDFEEKIAKDAFDIIFIDEAHHSRAKSWSNLIKHFSPAKQILLTATPFRRDKKKLMARLVYHYPLKQAFDDGLFSKINYIPVASTSSDPKIVNINIAKKVEQVYTARPDKNHKIIIRTDSKTAAEELFKIYGNETKLKLTIIHSKLTDKTIKQRIALLKNGEVDGIVCVDMMGEGYDFPLLKIAAIHIPHRSLAITFQFVGRIARTNTKEGKVATVVAGEHSFKIDKEQLFKETRDWSIILPNLHGEKIAQTEDEQDFFDAFSEFSSPESDFVTATDEIFPIRDEELLPFFHVKAYQIIQDIGQQGPPDGKLLDITKSIDFSGTSILVDAVVKHHHVSVSHEVAIYVISERRKPKWLDNDENEGIRDIKNQLFVVYFDEDNSIFFICATVKEIELYEHIVLQYLAPNALHEIVPLPLLKRVMAGWLNPKIFNLGMRNRKIKGHGESYRNYLGPSAQVLPEDKYNYTRGHSFGGGFDRFFGREIVMGISSSAKIWSLEENKIKYLVEWMQTIARKINDPDMDKLFDPLSELDSGEVVTTLPNEQAFFADWDPSCYHKNTSIVFLDSDDEVVEQGMIATCKITGSKKQNDSIHFTISKGDAGASLFLSITPVVHFEFRADSLNRIAIRQGTSSHTGPEAFLSYLKSHPIHFYFENLSHLVGRILFPFKNEITSIAAHQIEPHNWPLYVDVRKEFYSMNDVPENTSTGEVSISIHDYIIQLAKAEFDVVFYDHASLEIADVVGLSRGKIKFFHCKKQEGTTPRCSIDDIYEVNGQAVKSINWANRKTLLQQMINRADHHAVTSKIKKGTLDDIKDILISFENPSLPVEIVIVAPGLKSSNFTVNQAQAFQRISTLLSASHSFLKNVSACSLKVMCS